ncbi:MAG: peptidylprolyl isomerase [Pseudomonadota bacterium]
MTRILIGMVAGFVLAAIVFFMAQQDQRAAGPAVPANGILAIPESAAGEAIVRQGPAELASGELKSVINAIPEEDRAPFLRSSDRLDKMLGDLLMVRLMAIDGIESGLLDSAEVAGGLRQAALSYLGQEQSRKVRETAELEDYTALAKEEYLARPERYMLPETVDFTQLYLADREQRDEADLIQEIHVRLEAGEELEALIREYSDEANGQENPGRYQDARLSELDSAFADEIRSLAADEADISRPFETRFGWHIVRLDAYQPEEQQSFEEVADELERQARAEVRNRALRRYMNALISEHDPEVNAEALERLLDQYGVEAPGTISVEQGSPTG